MSLLLRRRDCSERSTYVYEHQNGHKHIACDKAYHLPEHVSKHVDLVTPTLHFDAKVKPGAPLEKRDGKIQSVGAPGFGPVSKRPRRLVLSRSVCANWRVLCAKFSCAEHL